MGYCSPFPLWATKNLQFKNFINTDYNDNNYYFCSVTLMSLGGLKHNHSSFPVLSVVSTTSTKGRL